MLVYAWAHAATAPSASTVADTLFTGIAATAASARYSASSMEPVPKVEILNTSSSFASASSRAAVASDAAVSDSARFASASSRAAVASDRADVASADFASNAL